MASRWERLKEWAQGMKPHPKLEVGRIYWVEVGKDNCFIWVKNSTSGQYTVDVVFPRRKTRSEVVYRPWTEQERKKRLRGEQSRLNLEDAMGELDGQLCFEFQLVTFRKNMSWASDGVKNLKWMNFDGAEDEGTVGRSDVVRWGPGYVVYQKNGDGGGEVAPAAVGSGGDEPGRVALGVVLEIGNYDAGEQNEHGRRLRF